jgi:hypothetical protein
MARTIISSMKEELIISNKGRDTHNHIKALSVFMEISLWLAVVFFIYHFIGVLEFLYDKIL